MAAADLQADLAAAAQEELERAATLSRKDLAACAPWGDTYEGYTPAGRDVCFERNYLWSAEPGGDICIEVMVYLPEHYETGVRLTRLVPQEDSV